MRPWRWRDIALLSNSLVRSMALYISRTCSFVREGMSFSSTVPSGESISRRSTEKSAIFFTGMVVPPLASSLEAERPFLQLRVGDLAAEGLPGLIVVKERHAAAVPVARAHELGVLLVVPDLEALDGEPLLLLETLHERVHPVAVRALLAVVHRQPSRSVCHGSHPLGMRQLLIFRRGVHASRTDHY